MLQRQDIWSHRIKYALRILRMEKLKNTNRSGSGWEARVDVQAVGLYNKVLLFPPWGPMNRIMILSYLTKFKPISNKFNLQKFSPLDYIVTHRFHQRSAKELSYGTSTVTRIFASLDDSLQESRCWQMWLWPQQTHHQEAFMEACLNLKLGVQVRVISAWL